MIIICKKHNVGFDPGKGEGCPECIEERIRATKAQEAERTGTIPEDVNVLPMDADNEPFIVKVKYKLTKNAGTDKEVVVYEGRAYSYFALEPLAVGDILEAPVQDHTMKAQVVEINVPESEIEAFRDKVKTIPAGSKLTDQTTEVELPAAETPPVGQVASLFDPKRDPNAWRTEDEEVRQAETEPAGLAAAAKAAGAEVTIVKMKCVLEEDKPAALTTIETQVGEPVPELLQRYLDASGLLQFAKDRVITTNEDLKPATDDLAIIAVCKKAMLARKEEIVRPRKTQLDAINQAFDDLMFPIMEADRLTRDQVNDFGNEQHRKAAEAKRIEDEKFKLAQAEAALTGTGEHTQELGTAQAPPPVPEVTRTGMGTLGGRANWKARVVDFKLLDDQWKLPNESLLNSHARSTKGERPIPGVEFYDDRVVTMRTK